MGWAARGDAQRRVITTLASMAGLTPGLNITTIRGFFPVFFDCITGKGNTQSVSPMSSGLFMQGALFAKTFYEAKDPGSSNTAQISKLALQLLEQCKFDQVILLLIGHGRVCH